MKNDGLMKCGEFAVLCNTTKNTLIHYDQVGVLKPSFRADNGYRYYTAMDYHRYVAIRLLVESGAALSEIPLLLGSDFDSSRAIVLESIKRNEALIDQLQQAQAVLRGLLDEFEQASDEDFCVGRVMEMSQRTLLEIKCPYEAMGSSQFAAADKEAVDLLKSIGGAECIAPYGVVSRRSRTGGLEGAAYYFLQQNVPELPTMPAGEYVCIGYIGAYGGESSAYDALDDYVDQANLNADGLYYEIALLRVFDADPRADYRCSIYRRVDR